MAEITSQDELSELFPQPSVNVIKNFVPWHDKEHAYSYHVEIRPNPEADRIVLSDPIEETAAGECPAALEDTWQGFTYQGHSFDVNVYLNEETNALSAGICPVRADGTTNTNIRLDLIETKSLIHDSRYGRNTEFWVLKDEDFLEGFGKCDDFCPLYGWPDDALAALKGEGNPAHIDLSESNVHHLSPLQRIAPEVKFLDLSGCEHIEDIAPIAALKNLKTLRLDDFGRHGLNGTFISDDELATALNGLDLQELSLTGSSEIYELAPVAKLPNLLRLDLSKCLGLAHESLEPLEGLKNLQTLYLGHTYISALPDMARMGSLRDLDLSRTRVTDLTPLKKAPSLQMLDLSDTPVTDLSPLEGIGTLEEINLEGCYRDIDLSPLRFCNGLARLILPDGSSCSGAALEELLGQDPNRKSPADRAFESLFASHAKKADATEKGRDKEKNIGMGL